METKMKTLFFISILSIVLGISTANAEGGTSIFEGAGFMIAQNICSSLRLQIGDRVLVSADSSVFSVDRIDSGHFVNQLRLSIPRDGRYVFETDGAFSRANELKNQHLDIKYDGQTLTIQDTVIREAPCVLARCPAFGSCEGFASSAAGSRCCTKVCPGRSSEGGEFCRIIPAGETCNPGPKNCKL
jgi:hypothetical protein